MKNYTFELYEDNAGRYNFFALLGGVPVAGFCTDDKAEVIEALRDSATDPDRWEGQFGDDQVEGKAHTEADISAAYEEITGWVSARNGGAQELDIEKFLRAANIRAGVEADADMSREQFEALPYDTWNGVMSFWESGYDYDDPDFWESYPEADADFIRAVRAFDRLNRAEANEDEEEDEEEEYDG